MQATKQIAVWAAVLSCSTPLCAGVYYGVRGSEVSMIMRANLDGSGVPQAVYLTARVGDLALVGEQDRIYWSSGSTVLGGSFNGGSPPITVTAENWGISGLGIDWKGGAIYYGVNGPETSMIMRANSDGSGVPQVIYTTPSVGDLALDGSSNTICWSSGTTVFMGNLSGSGVPTAVANASWGISGLGVDWDRGVIYYGEDGPEVATIMRANVDGSGAPQAIYTTPTVGDIVLDSESEAIYWSSGETVRRGNLDGSAAPEVLVVAGGQVSGLGIDACAGDVDGDGITDLDDLIALLANYGLSPAIRDDGDVNGDAIVDLDDLLIVLGNFECR